MKSKAFLGEELTRSIAMIIIRRVAGFKEEDLILKDSSERSREIIKIIIDRISETIIIRTSNGIYCRLCGRGPLSRRGVYLHMRRVHLDDIIRIINEEYDSIVRTY